ncbi:MAG: hypothetical protein MUF15_11720, partial [Acidobacteria bacterium]|nr:hypothetical protein [Acidobacteriota bacterium]
SRIDYLKLPKIDFYQLHVEYETVIIEENSQTNDKISAINARDHFDTAFVVERGLSPDDIKTKDLLEKVEGDPASFSRWIFTIARESMGRITRRNLLAFEPGLTCIFNEITVERQGARYYNDLFRQDEIRSRICLAFHKHRELRVRSEIIPQNAALLIIKDLKPIDEHEKLYPVASEVNQIMLADKTGKGIAQLQQELEAAHLKMQEFYKSQLGSDLFTLTAINPPKPFSPAVVNKDVTFHYLPYDFSQSRFELQFLQEVLNLKSFHEKRLEIYYNGDPHLTDFRIVCYTGKSQNRRRIGLYTPDFLVIKRKDGNIYKILIIETKGSGFSEQSQFIDRKHFIETEFLKMNNEKFGYNRFEFLYLPDDRKLDENLLYFQTKIADFFEENR